MIETPDGLRTVSWDLPHDLAMVGKARQMVREVVTSWDLSTSTDDIVLVVGELLGNAVSHGLPPIRLTLLATTREFCVRVTDHGPDQPRQLRLDIEAVHGRGLPIVSALADDHGVCPLPGTPGQNRVGIVENPHRPLQAATDHDRNPDPPSPHTSARLLHPPARSTWRGRP